MPTYQVETSFGAPPATIEVPERRPAVRKGRRILRVETKKFTGRVVLSPVLYDDDGVPTDFLVEVREARRRKSAPTMLSDLARWVLFQAAKAEVNAQKAAKKAKRKSR